MKNLKYFFLFLFLSLNSFAIEKADIIYTGGVFGEPYNLIGDLGLGHVGIFSGIEKKDGKIKAVIIDCVPDYFSPGGIRKVSWKNFTHNFKYPYYGNRTTKIMPTTQQRDNIIKIANKMLNPKAYNFLHTNQKGPNEFDCVGFAEYLYERVGLNPTPNNQETGYGWPLTPSEQFYSTTSGKKINIYESISISFTKTKEIKEIDSLKNISENYTNKIDVPLPKNFIVE